MHVALGAIIFGVFVALYLLVLTFERQSRSSQMINRHPYRNPYIGAPGASREGPADRVELTTSVSYARGTR